MDIKHFETIKYIVLSQYISRLPYTRNQGNFDDKNAKKKN